VGSAQARDYGFAAEAALAAASAAAEAAEAASAAEEAAESADIAGGGVGSAAGAGASVLLPQALSMNAAAKALRANLVFIYRYPRNFKDKKFRPSLYFWANAQTSRSILECFAAISYLFREACSRLNCISYEPFKHR
jgi:hypothetical protein